MASKSQSMYMSSSAGRSSEHKHSTSTKTGDDSDSSFSADFKNLRVKPVKVVGEHLGQDYFGSDDELWARVLFGEIFTGDDDDYEIGWDEQTSEVVLTWSEICNLLGEEGICCDDGSGWAGWDDTDKCYLRKNSNIESNEHCMRIIEIDQSTKSEVASDSRKAARKARKARKAKDLVSGASVEEVALVDNARGHTCAHVSTKGKSKGSVCGKNMVYTTDKGMYLCGKHAENHRQKTENAQIKKVIESGLILPKTSEADKKIINSDKPLVTDHSVSSEKKVDGSRKKIENSEKEDNELPVMTSTTNIKNMSDALVTALSKIFTGTLTEKYAAKAIAALQTDEAQAVLAQVIEEKMPTKAVRAAGKAGKRRKKDPAAPKRGCSSYIFFCKAKRSAVKDANPDFKGTDVTKELGRIWREETSDKSKKRYVNEASADKDRYIEEMKNYTPSAEWLAEVDATTSDSDGGSKKKTKKKTRKPGPKRARSSYIFFCVEMRSQVKEDNDDMDAKDITAELGRMWREEYKDDDNLNKKFTKMAKKDKKRFEKEKAEWVEPDDNEESFAPEPAKSSKKKNKKAKATVDESELADSDEQLESKKSSSSKKAKATVDESELADSDEQPASKKSSKKKKKKLSGFIVFCQQTRQTMREENPDWSMMQVTKEMEKIWDSMDSEEQAEY
jgi:hypothetical protein